MQIVEKHISINIVVGYDSNESISMFAEYLMDLDNEKRDFYFRVIQKIDRSVLRKHLEANNDILFSSFVLCQDSITTVSSDINNATLEDNKQKFIDKLFKIYCDSLKITYEYANEDFSLTQVMEKQRFIELFNYAYLSADRQMSDSNDIGRKKLTSRVVDLLNVEKENELSSNKWKRKIDELLNKLSSTISNEEIDTYLLEQSKGLLKNISDNLNAVGETNIQELSMNFDLGIEYLFKMLKDIIRVNYAIPINPEKTEKVLLTEESQGLGISNLIYITLELMKYKASFDSRLINLFLIEEPESHMHLQMQRTLINYLNAEYFDDEKYNIQGVITTHSNEIVRASELKNIRVIRPKAPLKNIICDLSLFLEKNAEEKSFYETFFSINFSNMVFADKAIIYEGDTERMFIESLIFGKRSAQINKEYPFLERLSKQYITYAQAGGAYAHKYAALLNELEINALILTDIDYSKSCDKGTLLESETSNAAIKYFYQSNKMDGKLTVDEIYNWQASEEADCHVLVKTQIAKDGCARTLEESILFQYIVSNYKKVFSSDNEKSAFDVFTHLQRTCWEKIKEDSNFALVIPNRTKAEIEQNVPVEDAKRSIREIMDSLSDKKSNFMYSIIMEGMQYSVLPSYLMEGLKWLAGK